MNYMPCLSSCVAREALKEATSAVAPKKICSVAPLVNKVNTETSSFKPPYIHFCCVAGIHGGCG